MRAKHPSKAHAVHSEKTSHAVSIEPPQASSQARGSQAEYEKFLPLTHALEERDVLPFRADSQIARHNVAKGVAAVLEHEATIREMLPKEDVTTLRELPALALAVDFAVMQTNLVSPEPSVIKELVARVRELRKLLLLSADALVAGGLFPAEEVNKIRQGVGPMDAANDCIALAALFQKHSNRIKGKSVVTSEHLTEAAELGTQLRTLLKPQSALPNKRTSPERLDARNARDRLWTLLTQRYDRLWRVGAYLFGKDLVDQRVPPLQSRARPSRRAAATDGQPVAEGAQS